MLRTGLLAAVAFAGLHLVQADGVDLLIHNARVYTGDRAAPWAQAIAIRGERVSHVGSDADLAALTAARRIDAQGRLVIPGINDAHTHPAAYPAHTALEGPPAVVKDPSWTEILDRVRAAVAKAPANGWIIGEIGGAVLEDPQATRVDLDPISNGRPVMLHAWHGHGAIFNTAAMRALEVSETEGDPRGGFFGRMPDGKTLTGLAHEYAVYGLTRRLALLAPPDVHIAAYREFARTAAAFGITSVQAMMVSYPAERAADLLARAKLPIRVRVIPVPIERPDELGCRSSAPMVLCSGVKYIVDGTPIERLMYLRAPYNDLPASRGRLNFNPHFLVEPRLVAARVQPMFHVVGDAALDAILEQLDATSTVTKESIRDPGPGGSGGSIRQREYRAQWHGLRPRLEHADMLEPGHFELAKKLGVVVVQNPAHFMIPDVFRARLGDRVKRTAMVKSILRAGIPFALGSDGPLNPFQNIMFATMNPTNPTEALTVDDALAAYTQGAAYAEMRESEKGRLARGMLADLAILSQDIFSAPTAELPGTTSVLTVVGGRIVSTVENEVK